jgi:hypothetical protein
VRLTVPIRIHWGYLQIKLGSRVKACRSSFEYDRYSKNVCEILKNAISRKRGPCHANASTDATEARAHDAALGRDDARPFSWRFRVTPRMIQLILIIPSHRICAAGHVTQGGYLASTNKLCRHTAGSKGLPITGRQLKKCMTMNHMFRTIQLSRSLMVRAVNVS